MVYSSSDMSNHYYPEPPSYRKLPACGCKKISPCLLTRSACAYHFSSTFFAPSMRALREEIPEVIDCYFGISNNPTSRMIFYHSVFKIFLTNNI